MYEKDFKVKLIGSKNSFLFLSEHDSRQVDHEHMIRLSYGLNKRAFFSLGTSMGSLKEGELAISSILAKELGIIKNDVVTLSTTRYIANIRRLKLLTVCQDDYETIGVLAETVQSTLLNQVKIVHNQQKLVIWITNSLHVTVVVDGIEPISPGKLEMLTEVAILPPENEPVSKFAHEASGSQRRSVSSAQQKESTIMNVYNHTQCTLRLHPVTGLPSWAIADKKAFIEQPFSALLSRRHFDRLAGPYHAAAALNAGALMLVTLQIISPPSDIKDLLDEKHEAADRVTVRLFCIDDEPPRDNADGRGEDEAAAASQPCEKQWAELRWATEAWEAAEAVFVHPMMFEYFRVRPGAKVVTTPAASARFVPKSIDIVTTSPFFNKADELVRNYLCRYCQDGGRMLVNSGLVMEEPAQRCRFALKFNPANERYLVVDARIMRECKFTLMDVELVEGGAASAADEDKPLELCLNCSNYQQIIEEARSSLLSKDFSVIIVGKPGTGKTSLSKKIGEVLAQPPLHTYVEYVSCKRLKGKNIESLLKSLSTIFLRLIYYQPSVLILDDLHVICERVVDGEPPTQENLYFNKVSDILAQKLERLLKRNDITLLATSESMGKLNRNIYSSRGKHLLKNCISINDLSKDDRTQILRYFIEKKEMNCEEVDFNQLALKTDGFLVQDLQDLVDKIIFEVYKSAEDLTSAEELKIRDSHCETALSNASTLALSQVQLHSPGERDFSDIGGLEEVKKILIETMLWPAKYANIFAHAPLRLQSGVLLYGPPGTGKTILAGAAAKQCNLRLISVKGPELLSKYIGASEQAVRDVFQKAQSAKPCILFFDEFDSLAPRRGHDSTGVTDRVVNQFLTQLDGVESLTGVCVLAATSRPDLLDPALLRPGRLDRQILCPMPDKTSRLAILKSLSKKLTLSKGIRLESVADRTEGFSGADLQAVLYTAQLNSVDHLLQDAAAAATAANHVSGETQSISPKNLDDAIRSTRPSLTREERAKYEFIYRKFQGKGDIVDTLKAGKQKATLA